jgi:hypothetical protein
MARSMVVRRLLAACLLFATASGCTREDEPRQEVRLLAPAWLVRDVRPFERRTGCLVDLRVYDENEDIETIARRRNVDVVARPVPPGEAAHASVELVRVTLARGLEITIPRRLASAFHGEVRPAGRRSIRWAIREQGDNEGCARRWLAYATSQ